MAADSAGSFDAEYRRMWARIRHTPERDAAEVEALWKMLQLAPGARVLDAPCGYGRLSRRVALAGARVLGVDASAPLIEVAQAERGELGPAQLAYRVHDLRGPLSESGFDAAFNVFTSLGFLTEAEDLDILRTVHAALRPGGRFLLETMHRDMAAVRAAEGASLALRLDDGTLFQHQAVFDALAGRTRLDFWWWGPDGRGEKSVEFRTYSLTELVALLERAGFAVLELYQGYTGKRFEPNGRGVAQPLSMVAERR
ncbi:MAG: methyltransferase domain-containing protein [Archangiaceae bacterium]|nr:methyltransferase domain-containing protein [Archangiaceae bacterium]